ncbi:MAG: hypothetical protein IT382_22790 [Deltaproteobacteria bacterium]|nr:hypothetical protein [Deltaproteobacteria bacterium]
MTFDPKTLNAEERALWDAMAIQERRNRRVASESYSETEGAFRDLLKARRALFGEPASEGKVECPNCLQPEEHPHFAGNLTGDGGWYFCPGRVPQAVDKRKPSQPELSGQDPARSGQPASEGGKVECWHCKQRVTHNLDHWLSDGIGANGKYTCQPAQPEAATCQHCEEPDHEGEPCYVTLRQPEPVAAAMLEAMRNAVNSLRACAVTARYPAILTERADALESFWRPLAAQPAPSVAMPEAVLVNTWQLEELLKYADLAEVALRTGFHPLEFLFEPADRSLRQCIDAIKEQRDQWRAHAAQPAPAVAMTEELERVLDAAEAHSGWHMDQGRPESFDEIDAAIAAVREQFK